MSLKIVSDGLAFGTKVFIDDREVGSELKIRSIKWSVDVKTLKAVATIECLPDIAELTADNWTRHDDVEWLTGFVLKTIETCKEADRQNFRARLIAALKD